MNNSEPMWNPMWNSMPMTPHQAPTSQGQFCSGDLNYQQQAQSQAQTQAQINALQQQNALLIQQLANQSFTHIQHLQQLVPHQQSMPQQSPSASPSLPTQPPVQPEPPMSTATPPSQPPTPSPNPPSLNTEEIWTKMRRILKPDLDAAVKKANERSLQLATPTQPLTTTQSTGSQHRTSGSQHPTTAHSSRRSRSPPRHQEPHRDDKRPVSIPRSPRRRPRSRDSSPHRRHGSPSYRGRESSGLCLQIVEVPAMTSSKMIAPIRVHDGPLLGHLNLPTHLPGTSPHLNKTGRPNVMTTMDALSHTATIQIGKTGTLGANGETSHLTMPIHLGKTKLLTIPIHLGMTNNGTHPSLRLDSLQRHNPPVQSPSRHSRPPTKATQANVRNPPNPLGNSHGQISRTIHGQQTHTEGPHQGISQGRHPE